MKIYAKDLYQAIIATMMALALFSCQDFFEPEQELNITEEQLFTDWYEYRSVEMGMYALQQKLVEQLVILGELRGDLLTITENADADLVEIYNFNISKTNKYASPVNFFKLIAAANNFIRVLEREHPEVMDKAAKVTNYDKLYGEALCMRAWAYFTAVKIYGKVPFIPQSLVTMEEIEQFINAPGNYVDSVYIDFSTDGYYNDTVYNQPVTLEKNFFEMDRVIDYFTDELESRIKSVGVQHDIDNPDATWEITIWNEYAKLALLGQMYLTAGDLAKARTSFESIVLNSTETYRYQITSAFAYGRWSTIFSNIDNREHILTMWFNKSNFQQHGLQNLFMPMGPYEYMLKPTKSAIHKWETTWMGQQIVRNVSNPALSYMSFSGIPGDPYRGFGSSYLYLRAVAGYEGQAFMTPDVQYMLDMKKEGDTRTVRNIMENMDTVVFKYYSGVYEDDAPFIIYRAGSIHLYLAEIYTYLIFNDNGTVRTNTTLAKGLVNDGNLFYGTSGSRPQLGVRGRVGLGAGDDQLNLDNIQYLTEPFTNEITGFINLTSSFQKKQLRFEEQLLNERARELAFEGERFYDLMRVAKRRNDPSFLAKIVSEKYPAGKREAIYNYLLDENNWYIHMFD